MSHFIIMARSHYYVQSVGHSVTGNISHFIIMTSLLVTLSQWKSVTLHYYDQSVGDYRRGNMSHFIIMTSLLVTLGTVEICHPSLLWPVCWWLCHSLNMSHFIIMTSLLVTLSQWKYVTLHYYDQSVGDSVTLHYCDQSVGDSVTVEICHTTLLWPVSWWLSQWKYISWWI